MKGHTYSKKNESFKAKECKYAEAIVLAVNCFTHQTKKLKPIPLKGYFNRKIRHILPRGKIHLKMHALGFKG